jgi:hypothetical protein
MAGWGIVGHSETIVRCHLDEWSAFRTSGSYFVPEEMLEPSQTENTVP